MDGAFDPHAPRRANGRIDFVEAEIVRANLIQRIFPRGNIAKRERHCIIAVAPGRADCQITFLDLADRHALT